MKSQKTRLMIALCALALPLLAKARGETVRQVIVDLHHMHGGSVQEMLLHCQNALQMETTRPVVREACAIILAEAQKQDDN